MSNSGKFYTLILSLFIAIFYSTLFHSVLKDCLSRRKVTARGHSNLRYIAPSAMETMNIEEQQARTDLVIPKGSDLFQLSFDFSILWLSERHCLKTQTT